MKPEWYSKRVFLDITCEQDFYWTLRARGSYQTPGGGNSFVPSDDLGTVDICGHTYGTYKGTTECGSGVAIRNYWFMYIFESRTHPNIGTGGKSFRCA